MDVLNPQIHASQEKASRASSYPHTLLASRPLRTAGSPLNPKTQLLHLAPEPARSESSTPRPVPPTDSGPKGVQARVGQGQSPRLRQGIEEIEGGLANANNPGA